MTRNLRSKRGVRPLGAVFSIVATVVLVASFSPSGAEASEELRLNVPDVELTDQDGRRVKFSTDLLAGRVVAINFLFTGCRMLCPTLAKIFDELQKVPDLPADARIISISLDPEADTPEKLREFASRHGRGARWTFLTGSRANVERVTRALGAWVTNPDAHSPLVVIGDGRGGFRRITGFTNAEYLARQMRALAAEAGPSRNPSSIGRNGGRDDAAAARYFTETEVIDQDNRVHRFYSDIVRGKIVLINFAFTSCTGVCSPITKNLAEVYRKLSSRVGKDIRMITVSVDPDNDSPAALKRFAEKNGATGPGWYFLTAPRERLEPLLRRLGGFSLPPDSHPITLIIGDAATGIWTKASASQKPEQIVHAVEHLNDPMPGGK